MANVTIMGADYQNVNEIYLIDTDTGDELKFTLDSGGDEPVGPTYETIVPLQTINCSIGLGNDAYGGYITNYTEYISEGQKYRAIFDGTEYTPLTAVYYDGDTSYLYIGDINVETASTAALIYPFEVMLYNNGVAFYFAVKGSGSHTLQVDKITSEGGGS